MNKKIKKITYYTTGIFVFYLSLFGVVFAEISKDYVLLEALPGISHVSDFGVYLAGMFKLSMSVAAVLAVLQISIAGFKYITEESFMGVSDAKKTLNNTVFGLILLFSSYLLLKTINPDLVNIKLDIPKITPGVKEKQSFTIGSEPSDLWFRNEEGVFLPTEKGKKYIKERVQKNFREYMKEEGYLKPKNTPSLTNETKEGLKPEGDSYSTFIFINQKQKLFKRNKENLKDSLD